MTRETISMRQFVYSIILFMFGSSIVMGVSGIAEQDSWISLFSAMALTFPMLMVYARIIKLFPEKDIFEVITLLFGKIAGKVLVLLFTWYAVHLSALVIRNFSEFLQIVSMPETPELPLMAALLLVTAYLAKSGLAAIGKWSVVMLPLVSIIILLTVVLSLKDMDLKNLTPVLEKGWQPVVEGTIQIAAFPFGETVMFLGLANAIKKEDSPYRVYGFSMLAAGFFLVLVMIRNISILGPVMSGISYFPSYTTARILTLGSFLSRIEGTITMNFLLSGMLKIAVCLITGAKGLAHLFGFTSYKSTLMPACMLALALCAIIYKSAMEMFNFLKYYHIYAVPFQVLLPLAVWIAAEIHTARQARGRVSS